MSKDNLKDYLLFEIEKTQTEIEEWEVSYSESARSRLFFKRLEAKAQWQKAGNVVPDEIRFRE